MTKELFENGKLALQRSETHGKRNHSYIEQPLSSKMEKREYVQYINVIDIKGFLNDIRNNWNTYVSQMNHWIQKNPVKKLVVTGIFTVILGLNTLPTNAAMVQEYTYQVKYNDNIENIARDHGVTVQEIFEANGITPLVGKKILLPKVQEKVVTATILNVRSRPNTDSSIFTRYKKGDKVKVSFEENGWAGILIKGRIYYVSSEYLTKKEEMKANATTRSSLYVIKSGDTFAKIGRTLGVPTIVIQELNPAVVSTKLKVGQTIKIPTAKDASFNHINVVAQIVGIEPGAFHFITPDGKIHAAGASELLMNEVSQQEGKTVTLTLEVKRGQQKTLISFK